MEQVLLNTLSNAEILAKKLIAFNAIKTPRVGDFVKLPIVDERQTQYTRISCVLGEWAQTRGKGSFYLRDSGSLEYSGGLDTGLSLDALIATDETKTGKVWIFDGNRPRAGAAVTFDAEMRVYGVKDGADLSGCWGSLACPYRLTTVTPEVQRQWGYAYKHEIRHEGANFYACDTMSEVEQWVRVHNYVLIDGQIAYPAAKGGE